MQIMRTMGIAAKKTRFVRRSEKNSPLVNMRRKLANPIQVEVRPFHVVKLCQIPTASGYHTSGSSRTSAGRTDTRPVRVSRRRSGRLRGLVIRVVLSDGVVRLAGSNLVTLLVEALKELVGSDVSVPH